MNNDLEILQPGEKVYKLRKLIGANQKDIAGDSITRNLISQIENNKTKLVYNTAKIISKNMNKIIVKKDIKNIVVTPEYLLEDLQSQIDNVAYIYIKELRSYKLEEKDKEYLIIKVKEVENFIFKYKNFKRISDIYEAISDIYFKLGFTCDGFLKLQISIDIALKNKEYDNAVRLLFQLSNRIYFSGGSTFDRIRNLSVALNLAKEHNVKNDDTLKKIYFNISNCYSVLGNNDLSIEYLNYIKDTYNLNIEEKLDVDLAIANCHHRDSRYEVAKKMYIDLLDIALKESIVKISIKAYSNLGTIFRIEGNYNMSIKYLQHAVNIKSDLDNIYYAKALYNALENYIDMDNKKYINNSYKKCLELLEKSNCKQEYKDIIVKLYNFFIKNMDKDNIYQLLKKVELAMKTNFLQDASIINLFFYTSYVFENNNSNMLQTGVKLLKNMK